MKYTVVSLFSGCGGTDLGFEGGFNFLGQLYTRNNFEIIWANDIDRNACTTYANYFSNPIVCADIRNILSGQDLCLFNTDLPINADVVIGGFPCQDFSVAGKRKGFNTERGTLYKSMVEVIKRIKPKLFLAENVRGLLSVDNGEAIKQIIQDFANLGYNVQYQLLHAANYGVPQNRERIIIVGTQLEYSTLFEYPQAILNEGNWITIEKAIGDLEVLDEGNVPNHFWSKAKMFHGTQGNSLTESNKIAPTIRAEHHGNIEFHWNGKRRLSAREVARIQTFPDEMIFYPSTSSAYKQIGNAVPPVFAWHLAKSVQKYLDGLDLRKTIRRSNINRQNTKETTLSISAS